MRLPRRRSAVAGTFTSAGRPAGSIPWREANWCAVDLELTGLDPRRDEIIAIGATAVEHGRVVLGKSFYTLVHSSRRSEPGAVLVHKLRVADLIANRLDMHERTVGTFSSSSTASATGFLDFVGKNQEGEKFQSRWN